MKKAYLYLENGQVLEGQSFGASGTATGELVFTTGMIGCVESLTDPSYHGQLVIYTFPQFGNYGICQKDMESPQCQMGGVVVREVCETPSNFRCDESADAFLKAQNVVGIAGIDTRMLTQMIRDNGVLNAVITTEETAPDLDALKAFRAPKAAEAVSRKETAVLAPEGEADFHVAVMDCGVKQSTLDRLVARKCKVTVFPYNTPAEEILAVKPDGILVSNGPGDPTDAAFGIEQIQALFGKAPMFGISLGHQMMALAAGAKTIKLKFGHRGANQPAKDMKTGKVAITSQNHGYAVDSNSLAGTKAVLRWVNVNDGTCEGVDFPDYHAFSVQFDLNDAAFDRFIDLMKEGL